jgi:hypothetical protein
MSLFLQLIKHPQFYGASVTMPHKVAILKHLDGLTEEGRDVGAVNTLFIQEDADGKRLFMGTNTDVIGIRDAFAYNVDSSKFHNRPALVIGGGGAARSAVYALRKWMKASAIYLVSRHVQRNEYILTLSPGKQRPLRSRRRNRRMHSPWIWRLTSPRRNRSTSPAARRRRRNRSLRTKLHPRHTLRTRSSESARMLAAETAQRSNTGDVLPPNDVD